jgi:hypothetical protein
MPKFEMVEAVLSSLSGLEIKGSHIPSVKTLGFQYRDVISLVGTEEAHDPPIDTTPSHRFH